MFKFSRFRDEQMELSVIPWFPSFIPFILLSTVYCIPTCIGMIVMKLTQSCFPETPILERYSCGLVFALQCICYGEKHSCWWAEKWAFKSEISFPKGETWVWIHRIHKDYEIERPLVHLTRFFRKLYMGVYHSNPFIHYSFIYSPSISKPFFIYREDFVCCLPC